MANIAYVRVSSIDQNELRQVEGLKKYDIEKWFTEKISAKDTKRPQLQAMLEYAREGDTIYIWDFSRLARNTKDLLSLIEQFQAKGINLISCKENMDMSTPTGKLLLTMVGAINEFERANLLERQREGITLARVGGKFKGRKEICVPDFEKHYARYKSREVSKVQLAEELNVSRPTLDRLISKQECSFNL